MLEALDLDYGMFTEDGNACVHGIVTVCKTLNLPWAVAYDALREIAKTDKFGEAMDTMVREIVYDVIGAGERNESFYI